MIREERTNLEIVNFFKEVKLYDKEKFKKIEERKVTASDFEYDAYPILDDDGVLIDFWLALPKVNSTNNTLTAIYGYAKALMMLDKIGKNYEETNLDEVMPIALERIYLVLNRGKKDVRKFNKKQISMLNNADKEAIILALALQFQVLSDYEGVKQLLIPDEFYVDDLSLVRASAVKNLGK